jgi:hypothetical protein
MFKRNHWRELGNKGVRWTRLGEQLGQGATESGNRVGKESVEGVRWTGGPMDIHHIEGYLVRELG